MSWVDPLRIVLQVRALEEYHVNQAARIGQGAKSLQMLQQQMREAAQVKAL